MTAAGLGLNKFCYAGLIAAHKNKEPVTDDVASKVSNKCIHVLLQFFHFFGISSFFFFCYFSEKILELVEQSKGWSAVEAPSDIPVRSMMGMSEEELYNIPTAEFVFRRGGFLNREFTVYHVAFHSCADLKNVEVPYSTSTNKIIRCDSVFLIDLGPNLSVSSSCKVSCHILAFI